MRQVSVLIADDSVTDRSEVRVLLTAIGHTVVAETDTSAKALSLARGLRPDLVIVEASLSPLSGFDTAALLAAEGIAPTILVTAHVGEETLERIGKSGALGFLAKPLRAADLGPLIQLAVARWELFTELNAEIAALNERMEARKLVGRAKAILMEKLNLQERDAFRRIQAQSAALNKPVHEIARAIITAHDVST